MGLQYKDVDDWKPAGVSIVDVPSHPLAIFEVYDNDEAFIKKYVEVNNMSNENNGVQVSEGFFEKLLNNLITKSDDNPVTTEPSSNDKVVEALDKINDKLENMDKRISKLEESDDSTDNDDGDVDGDPTPGAITKSEGEGEADTDTDTDTGNSVDNDTNNENNDTDSNNGNSIDNNQVITKSIDPDLVHSEPPKESFMARLGRDENGMKIRK